MLFISLLINLAFTKEEVKKVFTINLNDIDSSKDLLKQIYEKADKLGFSFDGLISANKPGEYKNFLTAKEGTQQKQKSGNADESPKKNAEKYPKTAEKQKQNTSKDAKSSKSSKTSQSKSSKSPVSKSSKAQQSRSSKSSVSKSSKSPISKSSKAQQSRSSKSSVSKSVSKDKSSSISKPDKSRLSSANRADKSVGSSVKSDLYSKSASKMSSDSIGKSFSSHDSSQSADKSLSESRSASDVSPTSTASISGDVIEEIEKVKNMDQSTLENEIKNCKDCEKVNGLLVYKEGDVWKDYSGKIEMKMVNGKLVDKTGIFMGKDCGCKKEEIPEMGKVTETGLYQDKNVSQSECEKQNNMIHHLANASSVSADSSYAGSESASVSGESYENASTIGDSTSSASAGGDATSSVSAGDSTSDTTSTGGDATSSASSDSASTGGDATSTGGDATSSASTGGDTMPTGNDSQVQSMSAPTQPSYSTNQPASTPSVQQPPVIFKAIKLKYDLACDENSKDGQLSSISKPTEKQFEYKTQTVTIIDEKRLPPETIFKTITKVVIPETVSKTFTQILKPEVVTITQKPDTVIKYSPPKTITKVEKSDPVTVTKIKSIEPEIDQVSEDMIDEPIQKVIKPSRDMRKVRKMQNDVVTVSKTVKVPYKGVECVPDCPCENEGTCDNPCMEIKCEIVE